MISSVATKSTGRGGLSRLLLSGRSCCNNHNNNVSFLPRTAPNAVGAIRHLNLHEYLSMDLMKQHGISTPAGFVASSPEEAENIFLHKINKGGELWKEGGNKKRRPSSLDIQRSTSTQDCNCMNCSRFSSAEQLMSLKCRLEHCVLF